jgi:hypothetical protein
MRNKIVWTIIDHVKKHLKKIKGLIKLGVDSYIYLMHIKSYKKDNFLYNEFIFRIMKL